jgi:hypothetical protein
MLDPFWHGPKVRIGAGRRQAKAAIGPFQTDPLPLLEDLARKKFAATTRPRKTREQADDSRVIPAAVKRAVWLRDGGRCAFVATDGHRCAARGFLEFHHRTPYAAGGKATVDNIELRCRSHNAHEAELYFFRHRSGPDVVREASMDYGRLHVELVPGRVRPGRSNWLSPVADTGS